jgi:protein gp37
MAENSKIEWTDHTFNPWRGCTKVSPGCAHCYAETLSQRNPKVLGEWGPGKPRVLVSDEMWKQPLKWNREAGAVSHEAEWSSDDRPPHPRRPRVFCASLADWLDDEVPIEWLADLMELIVRTPNLDWLLLTKRPQNWRARIEAVAGHILNIHGSETSAMVWAWKEGFAPPNVWIGATVEDQTRADERIPLLLSIPAKVRFLSCEPLLGPVDLSVLLYVQRIDMAQQPVWRPENRGIHWVICGGESGTHARAMHPEWARSLRDQCSAACVPFFFKQWGEWVYPAYAEPAASFDDFPKAERGQVWQQTSDTSRCGYDLLRLGKKKAGRLLDGVEHNGSPQTGGTGLI